MRANKGKASGPVGGVVLTGAGETTNSPPFVVVIVDTIQN